ncbi:hypothetical protein Pint_00403 [Pistacia integerrima]|uniref:Uncharacterized protein n=1 Tax=Pistacia integerrima TaxID=434235 RepID=A0ACC0ZNJ9_9ROSI|nr:hypothetical protein Pint_00403 [Pistacia integerrima]
MENIGAVLGFCVRGTHKCSHFVETTCRSAKRWTSATISLSFFTILFIGSFIYWLHVSVIPGSLLHQALFSSKSSHKSLHNHAVQINCLASDLSVCPADYMLPPETRELPGGECPDYFRWIHKDLQPWKKSGITREMVESGKDHAHFRLVIVEGKAYVEKYKTPYQTRDLFTMWGILQLLRFYPGKVPDLELMFWCEDRPVIHKNDYQGPNATFPPPVFHYCGHQESLDIVFPDWTFWGWAETNIKPWGSILEDLKEGNKRIQWQDRVPYAYWKGNPHVSDTRGDLMKCNVSERRDWNARLHIQDWNKEMEEGYKNSKLEDQCTHRYKIFVEGAAWSVSDKYILACDSMTLVLEPEYYDFFIRSIMPMKHYWPIRTTRKCRDIKFAVDWGNKHSHQAQAIGKEGSKYIQEQLKMKYVYDYMLHLLIEYAKLLKFKPRITEGAKQICSQTMACSQDGLWKQFMVESMVNSSSETVPCSLPSPFEPVAVQAFLENKEMVKKQVEMWEGEYWENLKKQQ